MLTKSENLKYQLQSLASYEPDDLANPEFDVGYKDEHGNEGFEVVCCVDVAERALERIKMLESKANGWDRVWESIGKNPLVVEVGYEHGTSGNCSAASILIDAFERAYESHIE